MEGNSLEFTAIRGVQAGTAFWVVMVPLGTVTRLFRFDDDVVPAALRAQRRLNRARIPEIAAYIAGNPGEYILSALCASVDGEVEFEAAAAEGPLRGVGRLRIALGATILINDGQHRRAAIEEAVRERPLLGDETIPVVVFADKGLARSQQMFADLNMHAVRPARSIKLLYDHRDALAGLARDVVEAVPLFREFTCFESASVPARSLKLFAFSGVHQATAELVGKARGDAVTSDDLGFATAFWSAVVAAMPDWRRVATRDVLAAELRRDYVHAHGVALQAIAMAGARLVAEDPAGWAGRLAPLSGVDWSRSNRALWEGRALVAGKINKARNNVVLVGNVVSEALGVPLSADARRVEELHAPRLAPRAAG